jgi:hypothetical protein
MKTFLPRAYKTNPLQSLYLIDTLPEKVRVVGSFIFVLPPLPHGTSLSEQQFDIVDTKMEPFQSYE